MARYINDDTSKNHKENTMSSQFITRKTVAEYLTDAIANSGKTQKLISDEMGYDNPSIITMFKQGSTPVPLKKVGPLAQALGIDPICFLRLVMLEYMPETYEAIEQVLAIPLLTKREKLMIESFRKITNWTDPSGVFLEGDDVTIMTGFLIPYQSEGVNDFYRDEED